jgi:hypothetical protein
VDAILSLHCYTNRTWNSDWLGYGSIMSTKRYPCVCGCRIRVAGLPKRIHKCGRVSQPTTRTCHARRSLRFKPSMYTRQPKCQVCGGRNWIVDTYRMKHEMGNAPMCMCSGLAYPHRKGCKYCYSHPNAEQDHIDQYGGSS